VMALFQAAEPLHSLLWYERGAILHGEVWRLLTAHALHLGWMHLLYNGAGLVLYWLLFGQHLGRARLAVVWSVTPLAVGIGLLAFSPSVVIYVGLSGVLHGAFLHAAVGRMRAGWWDGPYLLVLLVAKVIWEQWQGPLPGTAATIGGAVIVDAHLYGLLAGAAVALAGWRRPAPERGGQR